MLSLSKTFILYQNMKQFTYSRFTPSGLKKANDIASSTRLVLKEAEKLGISWETIPDTDIIKLQLGSKIHFFYWQVPAHVKAVGLFACNKISTKSFLKIGGISTAKGFAIYKNDSLKYQEEVFNSLNKPLVVKPTHGSHGDDVFIGINKLDKYQKIIRQILVKTIGKKKGVLVEKMFQNAKEFRVLVTRKKVIGITHRQAANVIGDGKVNVKQLIEQKNADPRRGDEWSDGLALLKIKIDKFLKNYLTEQNKSLNYIPSKNEQVFLRKVSNLSQGGDSFGFTDKAHQSVKDISLKAINAIPELTFAGIDFMTKDISKKQNPDDYIIVEVNGSPGFDMHDYPYQGKNRHATREFLNLIFPELRKRSS